MALRQSKLPAKFPKQPRFIKDLLGREMSSDEWQAHCFLRGCPKWRSASGESIGEPKDYPYGTAFFEIRFLSGDLEAQARDALIHILASRKPLSAVIRRDLIRFFTQSERRFNLKRRTKKRSSEPEAIAIFIREEMLSGEKFRVAVENAEKALNIGRTKAIEAWTKCKRECPELFGKEFPKAARYARRLRVRYERRFPANKK
jgi:hypothetical protein